MGGDNGVDWPTCSEDECIGVRLDAGGKCLAHADDQDLDSKLKRLGDEGTIDARGVTISAKLLDRILAAAPRDEQEPDRPRFNKVRFDRAIFGNEVRFDRAIFGNEVRFDRATVGDKASFEGATFGNYALFFGATFGDFASFDGATFRSQTYFDGATLGGWASFKGATFGEQASFGHATFGNAAWFGDTTFGNQASFYGATFGDMASFQSATFGDRARFQGATFGDQANFVGATFGDAPLFDSATFGNQTWFDGATFGDEASFDGATFGDEAWFRRATLADKARFEGTTFGDEARFEGTTLGDQASFIGATFGDQASFIGATFGDEARFESATFGDRARFEGAAFGHRARFDGSTFGSWARFGPLLAAGRLILDQAAFGQGSDLAISADRLDCRGMRLTDGAWLNVRWAEVLLDGVNFGRPSVLAGVGPFPRLDESSLRTRVARSWRTSRPRVLSMRGSDVRNLVLSNVDLRACRFTSAHNLDQLRLEATIDLADRPAGWRTGWAVPPLWRWTRRRTLAEEHRWRRAQAKHAGWYPPACRARGLAQQERSLRPADIALLYRALRKGREDSKDEPGAADFYYGEMEMRRHDRTAPWPERVVLWLYWLVAGYALRTTRALGWLLGVLAVTTALLATAGFASPPSATPLTATIAGTPPQQHIQLTGTSPPEMTAQRPFPDRLGTAALVAVEGAVFRTSDQALTYKGRVIQATLRFVGPVLLGLALLSIRGRVKR